MRLTLNERSTAEFLKIMKVMGVTNPTHALGILISNIYQHSIPTREDTNASTSTNPKQ